MNKAIRSGFDLALPSFSGDLHQWSLSGHHCKAVCCDGVETAAYVPADHDFDGCLEIKKTENIQFLLCTAALPIIAGRFIEVRTRIKMMSDPLFSVSVLANFQPTNGIAISDQTILLPEFNKVETLSAVIDLSKGSVGLHRCNIGLRFTGPNGGTVRIEDFQVNDISATFIRA